MRNIFCDRTSLLFKAVFTGQHFQTTTLQVGTAKTPRTAVSEARAPPLNLSK